MQTNPNFMPAAFIRTGSPLDALLSDRPAGAVHLLVGKTAFGAVSTPVTKRVWLGSWWTAAAPHEYASLN